MRIVPNYLIPVLFTFVGLDAFSQGDGPGPPPPGPPPPPGSPIDNYVVVLVVIAIFFAFYKLNLSKINKKSSL